MTKTSTPKTSTSETSAAQTGTKAAAPGFNGPDFEQVAEAGQRSLATLANLHSHSFREALKFNAELLDFAQRRISADIQTSDRLARCQSVTEAMDALSDFYQGAFRDYAEETTALVRLGSEIGTETAGEIAGEIAGENAGEIETGAARTGRKKGD